MSDTIGEWSWRGDTNRLIMMVEAEHILASLNGEWRLPDFGKLLDGLSLRRLTKALEGNDHSVTCELRLADGQIFQLAGAFIDENVARGVLVVQEVRAARDEGPGPTLVPVFQPILSLNTGRVAGFEALARWPDSRQRGKNNAARAFDDQALASNMLIHAAEALSTWTVLNGMEEAFVQVNLTSQDLVDDTLVDIVAALISGHKLRKGSLRLELTEQAALRDADRAVEVATALRDAGAALVLDDFGSGHSSFLWLAHLPADSLKIDADLIAQVANPRVLTILESLNLLARRLDMKTTAEGVEELETLGVLREIGFSYVQGFALGLPMELAATLDYLRDRAPVA